MKIRLTDFLNFMDKCNTIPELKIKCDLMYGEKFEVILNDFLQKMGYQILPETLASMTLKDIISYLELIGRNYEEKHRCYIQTNINYESVQYIRYNVEYCILDCDKLENISINI